MLVSFIIPSYNSGHTIKRCLDSIYALPLGYNEFEIIFIDDCSTDNTCAIVEEYIASYPNIILLKQPVNKRQGAARNRGVRAAKGLFICFVDSDDIVTAGIVSAIYTAKGSAADLIAFHTATANEEGILKSEAQKLIFDKGQIFTGIEMQNRHAYWCSAPWGYIYRANFLSKVNYTFAEEVLYEDSDFIIAHLYAAKRMSYSSQLGYLACYREGSTIHSNNYKNKADYMLLGYRMLVLYRKIQRDIDLGIRKDEGIQQFADSVLEGACWNISKALTKLYKLNNYREIVLFYERVDACLSRSALYENKCLYKFPDYWNMLTRIGLKHKQLSILLNSGLSLIYSTFHKF